jgi:hypothetical protein
MLLFTHARFRASAALLASAACAVSPSPAGRDSVPPSATAGPPAVTGQSAVPAPARPDSASPVSAPAPSSFSRILTQNTSGFDESAELAIRDQAALESAWARLFNQVQGNPAPAVDFTRETVILVALGRRTSGGNAVRVDGVTRAGEGALVRYTATSPGPGCMTTQSLTSPVDVVRVPRISGAVRFERHEVVERC